jgi:hypothetical protein
MALERPFYQPNDIRTALLLAGREYPSAKEALLKVAFHLGLDVGDQDDRMDGWPRGTLAPPLGGFLPDVPMIEQ